MLKPSPKITWTAYR